MLPNPFNKSSTPITFAGVRSTAAVQLGAKRPTAAGFGRIEATSEFNQNGATMSRTPAVVGSSLFDRVSMFQA